MATPKPNSRPSVASNRPLRKSVADYRVGVDAAQSPFFKLPPDLRNVIYGLVLGKDWDLHVFKDSKVWICPRASEKSNVAEGDPSDRAKYETHQFCHSVGHRYRYSTALLRVCRQINQEAALIPFHANNLMVDLHYFGDFLSALVPAQREAIKRLDLEESLGYWTNEEQRMGCRTPFMHSNLTNQLTNLRTLKVAVRRRDNYIDVEHQLEKLCNGLLESPTVKEIVYHWRRFSPVPRQSPEQFDDWAEKMEAKLSSPTTYLERWGEGFCTECEFLHCGRLENPRS